MVVEPLKRLRINSPAIRGGAIPNRLTCLEDEQKEFKMRNTFTNDKCTVKIHSIGDTSAVIEYNGRIYTVGSDDGVPFVEHEEDCCPDELTSVAIDFCRGKIK
jgi:hypothetical protein